MAAVERVDSSAGTWAWTVAGRVVAMVAVLPIPPHKLLMFQVVQVMQLLLFFVIYIVPYLISLGTSESTRTAMVL